MAFLIDNALDNGLSYVVTNGTRIDICSSEPATYAAATSTVSLGNKTGLTMDAISAHPTDGRRVMSPNITDGSVTGDGTATHWALTNGSNTLIATGTLTSQAVTNGNTFSLPPVQVAAIRDAAQV